MGCRNQPNHLMTISFSIRLHTLNTVWSKCLGVFPLSKHNQSQWPTNTNIHCCFRGLDVYATVETSFAQRYFIYRQFRSPFSHQPFVSSDCAPLLLFAPLESCMWYICFVSTHKHIQSQDTQTVCCWECV